jgi:Acetyltransferases, including N-acetylases of ribosomal proteins
VSAKTFRNKIKLERIAAVVNPLNKASVRVIQKIGMKFEKTGLYYGVELNFYSTNREENISRKT